MKGAGPIFKGKGTKSKGTGQKVKGTGSKVKATGSKTEGTGTKVKGTSPKVKVQDHQKLLMVQDQTRSQLLFSFFDYICFLLLCFWKEWFWLQNENKLCFLVGPIFSITIPLCFLFCCEFLCTFSKPYLFDF